jgi:hypothetical protein
VIRDMMVRVRGIPQVLAVRFFRQQQDEFVAPAFEAESQRLGAAVRREWSVHIAEYDLA